MEELKRVVARYGLGFTTPIFETRYKQMIETFEYEATHCGKLGMSEAKKNKLVRQWFVDLFTFHSDGLHIKNVELFAEQNQSGPVLDEPIEKYLTAYVLIRKTEYAEKDDERLQAEFPFNEKVFIQAIHQLHKEELEKRRTKENRIKIKFNPNLKEAIEKQEIKETMNATVSLVNTGVVIRQVEREIKEHLKEKLTEALANQGKQLI